MRSLRAYQLSKELLNALNDMLLIIESDGIIYPIRDSHRLKKVFNSIRNNQPLYDQLLI
jgi:hypothetical protein